MGAFKEEEITIYLDKRRWGGPSSFFSLSAQPFRSYTSSLGPHPLCGYIVVSPPPSSSSLFSTCTLQYVPRRVCTCTSCNGGGKRRVSCTVCVSSLYDDVHKVERKRRRGHDSNTHTLDPLTFCASVRFVSVCLGERKRGCLCAQAPTLLDLLPLSLSPLWICSWGGPLGEGGSFVCTVFLLSPLSFC